MKLSQLPWPALALVLAAGCGGGPKMASVEGQVMVDGKPYPNAYVTFQPQGTKENPNPGRGSMGITDAEGKFKLRYDDGSYGAIVGKHIVRITSVQPADDPARFKDAPVPVTGSPDGEPPDPELTKRGLKPEVIPLEWNTDSQKEFEVPASGTEKANFDITSIQAKKKGGNK